MKKIISILLIAVIMCTCLTGCMGKISGKEALGIALADAGLAQTAVYDIDIDYENEYGNKYYQVEFKNSGMEYEYIIDAASGTILDSRVKPDR